MGMPNGRKLVLDTFCEVYDLLRPWADDEFWDLSQHTVIPGAVYLLGRQHFVEQGPLIRRLAEEGHARYIMSNPHEGSDTIKQQAKKYGVDDLIRARKLLLIGGGDMQSDWPCLRYDSFLPRIYDFEENVQAAQRSQEIFQKVHKPYLFLFLNGRGRAHRRYLIERLDDLGLLDRSLWTCLSSYLDVPSDKISLIENGVNRLAQPRANKLLPREYEVDRYRAYQDNFAEQGRIKLGIFNNEWGEIYLQPEPYIDTYFSLVTETVFDYPYSFRTEKIGKPLAQGHPFVITANRGYYRDLREQGFRTFDHLIDESFDDIDNDQDRLDRIIAVVQDLCGQDLPSFLAAAQEVCKYNQQHLYEFRDRERREFPERFFQFVEKHG